MLPGVRVLQADLETIRRATREASGLTPLWDTLQLVRATQRHRGLSNGLLAGGDSLAGQRSAAARDLDRTAQQARSSVRALADAALSARVDAILQRAAELASAISRRSITSDQSFEGHTALVADERRLVQDIADVTGISFHAERAGHHLQAAVLQHLVQTTESLGRVRGKGTKMLTVVDASSMGRAELAVEIERVRRNMHSAVKALSDAELNDMAGQLAGALADAERSTAEAIALAEQSLLQAAPVAGTAERYFATLSIAIDKQFELIGMSFDILRARLERAVGGAQRHLVLDVAAGLAIVCLALWMLHLVNQAQRAQEASSRRKRAILAATPDAILVVDSRGQVQQANPAAAKLFGRPVVGVPLTGLFAAQALAEIRSALDEATAGRAPDPVERRREVAGERADGAGFCAEVHCFGVEDGDQHEAIVLVRDITERRRVERQLSQSQKMEAIGQLTGGLAHDFNNLLGVVVGNLDLLERSVAADEGALKRVRTAQKAALRGADLTRRMLAFARKQHLEPTSLRIADVVADIIELGSRTLGPDIVLNTSVAADMPEVLADAAGLENVLLNLIVNARDAMPRGGHIRIDASRVEIDETHPFVRDRDLRPGSYASLRVTDTGEGMTAGRLERVFEPFFTTKEKGKGTGLGLAMVYGFVKQSGGHIKIYSEVGVGTSVVMILPITTTAPAPAPERSARAEHQAPAGATALVVDDEPDLLEVAATYLKEMGYRVLTAPNGPAAMRTLAGGPPVDLLVTDVIMPGGMNGVKLSRKVRERHPDIRVVFTSGFASQALAERRSTRVDGPLVNKPFQRHELAAALNLALNGVPA